MASIADLGALVDEALTAVDNGDTSGLRRVLSKCKIIIAALGPDASTDQTFISYRNAVSAMESALEDLTTSQTGGANRIEVEFT